MRRRSTINFDVNHDRWLVSYSDFVTLLFAFFVVMYSISQVNEGKYRVLSSTLLEAFDVPQSAIKPIQVGTPSLSADPSAIETYRSGDGHKTAGSVSTDVDATSSNNNVADLDELSDAFSEQFADLVKDNLLTVTGNELWLELELNSNILFPSGNSDPSLQARAIFEEMAGMLSKFENPVQVEGFTDNVPINNRRFKSNWELSSARSASVVKLLANNGVDPYRLSAVGYGEFRPKADNSTAEGRSLNRRVVLMISKQAAERPKIQSEQDVENAIGEIAQDVPFSESSLEEIPTQNNVDSIVDNTDEIAEQVPQQELGVEAEAVPEAEEESSITPIQLDNGGLLFTNDPDLPRATN
ncbi:flagellar motor protein MotD [Aurantivibrio infirmus]